MTEPRFLSISDVAQELAVGEPAVRSLIRSGALPAIQIGGRGLWRIERTRLEEWIKARYEESLVEAREIEDSAP
ncbi:hypothetical protein GCM10012320_35180 [Sinomonas cellulolyticus]|uniref:Helix-turn-helix domain-containing protein n=1 Tax=Sinomonas cellulolyticus TaxID=2801916 RepID=A0ABS1K1A7_9MICC|nr:MULTISPECIES: helix-turn-helix domain-containing protein [Sinomonas]MBL0705082.1 helix-turn-helix domain-containing protein [Sinomonas cellulolyticus]GHG60569.1 hypothetical protein GCM10012320_35180 [Sinomonas sp. KCTC 49339]